GISEPDGRELCAHRLRLYPRLSRRSCNQRLSLRDYDRSNLRAHPARSEDVLPGERRRVDMFAFGKGLWGRKFGGSEGEAVTYLGPGVEFEGKIKVATGVIRVNTRVK